MNALIRFIGTILLAFPLLTQAQYPAKPIRLVVQFPPGGTADVLARILAQNLTQSLGQPVIVDNRPGADGAIAAEAVMKGANDGYTLLLASNSAFSAVPAMRKNPPYDPVTNFTPISLVGRFVFFFFTRNGLPAKTLQEFVSYARANPGKINYATGNTTSIVATAQFKSLAGIDMQHVPYKGDAPATADLLGGQVDLLIGTAVPGMALAKEGKIHVLASLLSRRPVPGVPSMVQAGFAEPSVISWTGLFGPAKLPREIVERLTREVNVILRRPEVKDLIERNAFEVEGSTPEELGAFVKQQLDVWRRALHEAGIQPE